MYNVIQKYIKVTITIFRMERTDHEKLALERLCFVPKLYQRLKMNG